jgi:hypothetical protein
VATLKVVPADHVICLVAQALLDVVFSRVALDAPELEQPDSFALHTVAAVFVVRVDVQNEHGLGGEHVLKCLKSAFMTDTVNHDRSATRLNSRMREDAAAELVPSQFLNQSLTEILQLRACPR